MSLRGKSVRRVPSPHPLREGAERIEIYLKAPRHPANHNSDAWDSGDEAKTLDCNILKRLSLPTEALAAALCKTMKYCSSVRHGHPRCEDEQQGRTAVGLVESMDNAGSLMDCLKKSNPYITLIKNTLGSSRPLRLRIYVLVR